MLKVGLTGGIGSGKSLVSRILEAMGYTVFNSDNAARTIVNENADVREALCAEFGADLYLNGLLDRPKLAKIIFSDNDARKRVNHLIHPFVREAFNKLAEKSQQTLIFNEAAILFETGAAEGMNRMILVTAPEEVRIRRVMQRDGVTEDEVRVRMKQQWSDAQKIPLADFHIINDEAHPLLSQVEQLVQELNAQLTSS